MSDMAKQPHLTRRGNVFWYRRRVPTDLVEVMGRRSLFFSLRTSDRREAQERARLEDVKHDQLFRKHREAATAPTRRDLTDQEAQALAARFRWNYSEAIRNQPPPSLTREELEVHRMVTDRLLADDRDRVAMGDVEDMKPAADAVLRGAGIKLDPSTEAYRRLAYELTKVETEVSVWGHRLARGLPFDPPPKPEATEEQPAADTGSGLTMSEAFAMWRSERKPSEATGDTFGTYVRRFTELVGDLPITAITKGHVREYKDALVKLPARLPRKIVSKPMGQLLAWAETVPDQPKLTAKTINTKALAAVSTVMNWAVANGYAETNPATGVRVADAAVRDTPRLPYSVTDLNLLFRLPVFTEGERPKGGAGEAAFWMPLLALFTGARMEELAQLLVADVKTRGDIPFLDMSVSETGKRYKNAASRRRVPIHRTLIDLGLSDYVETQAQAGETRLFPLIVSNRQQQSINWGKWYHKYTRDNGLTDKRLSFHSFRHTVQDGFRDSEVEAPLADAIMGRTLKGSSAGYGHGYSLRAMKAAVDRLAYPGLDLGRVRWPGGR